MAAVPPVAVSDEVAQLIQTHHEGLVRSVADIAPAAAALQLLELGPKQRREVVRARLPSPSVEAARRAYPRKEQFAGFEHRAFAPCAGGVEDADGCSRAAVEPGEDCSLLPGWSAAEHLRDECRAAAEHAKHGPRARDRVAQSHHKVQASRMDWAVEPQ